MGVYGTPITWLDDWLRWFGCSGDFCRLSTLVCEFGLLFGNDGTHEPWPSEPAPLIWVDIDTGINWIADAGSEANDWVAGILTWLTLTGLPIVFLEFLAPRPGFGLVWMRLWRAVKNKAVNLTDWKQLNKLTLTEFVFTVKTTSTNIARKGPFASVNHVMPLEMILLWKRSATNFTWERFIT